MLNTDLTTLVVILKSTDNMIAYKKFYMVIYSSSGLFSKALSFQDNYSLSKNGLAFVGEKLCVGTMNI